jgi:hypothetical protein
MDYVCAYCSIVLPPPMSGTAPVCPNCGAQQPAKPPSAVAPTPGAWLALARLATLSLAQTPEEMATTAGVPATRGKLGHFITKVPLSGGAWDTLVLKWSPSERSHVMHVQLTAGAQPDDDAAIRDRMAAAFGHRWGDDGTFAASWSGIHVSYEGTSANVTSVAPPLAGPYPRWKEAMDAAWDIARRAVLGLDVLPVPEASLRDWFRGYSLSAFAAIDPALDSGRAVATMPVTFPGATKGTSRALEFSMGVDHPAYDRIELSWGRDEGSCLRTATLFPSARAEAFARLDDLEGRIQAAFGAPTMRFDKGTLWKLAEGGELLVVKNGLTVTVSEPPARPMSSAGWRRVLGVLDAYGR